jgi:hypothetical protein
LTTPLRCGSLLWLAVLAIVVAHGTGCILAVPAFDHADHCAITGTSACATCLRKSCQPVIDGCCGDPKCSGGDGHSAVLDGSTRAPPAMQTAARRASLRRRQAQVARYRAA